MFVADKYLLAIIAFTITIVTSVIYQYMENDARKIIASRRQIETY
jgi:hypothetical protein